MPIRKTISNIIAVRPRPKELRVIERIFDPPVFVVPHPFIKKVDGVFEGGGSLGLAYAGALRVLEENNIWFHRVVGNSAGAITASMIAAGFTAREIQWLTSSFAPSPRRPSTLSDAFVPIDFFELLDPPNKNSLTQTQKRSTFLWKLLQLNVLNSIEDIRVPIPTRGELVKDILNGLETIPVIGILLTSAIRDKIAEVLDPLLIWLPDRPVQIRDFITTRNIRTVIADAIFDAILASSPQLTILLNLIHGGGLFDGNKLLTILKKYFGLKKFGDANAQVKFRIFQFR